MTGTNMKFSKVKVKKEFGEWYYIRIRAELDSEGYPIGDLDADIYEIYDSNKKHVADVDGLFMLERTDSDSYDFDLVVIR